MHSLTLQLYSGHSWHDAMRLNFEQPEAGLTGVCSFGYEQTYLLETLEHIGSRLEHAVSVTVPLDWESYRASEAPAFLHDILPMDLDDEEIEFVREEEAGWDEADRTDFGDPEIDGNY